MTVQKSFKRLVRARMEKTGESYTAARASLLAAEAPKATEGPSLSISDAVVRERSGRGWEEWFALLDEAGADGWSNDQLRAWLLERHEISGWTERAVTLNYQRARGLRAVGEHADGFSIGASKTVAVPVERLYDAFVDETLRARWLPDGELRQRSAARPKSARFDWGDGQTRVHVTFVPKGDAKSTAAVQHERLPDAREAERMKAFWRERVATLKRELEG